MIKKRFVGFTLFTFGLLLSLSKIALTGAVIGVSASSLISLIGALAMIGGLIVIVVSKKGEGELEERVKTPPTFQRTKAFDSSIAPREVEWVEKAIAKIGTGIGGEHKLRDMVHDGYPVWASDVSGKGRLLYTKRPGNVIVFWKYDSEHTYRK